MRGFYLLLACLFACFVVVCPLPRSFTHSGTWSLACFETEIDLETETSLRLVLSTGISKRASEQAGHAKQLGKAKEENTYFIFVF